MDENTVQATANASTEKRAASGLFTPTNLVTLAFILIIVGLTIYFRSGLLQFYGFYEPDGFYHYSVIRAAVNNGFSLLSLFSSNFGVPSVLSISGWPSHQPVTEAKGLYLVTLIPYSILQYAGISYYTVMRLAPVAFALLDMLGAYLLSRYLSKDKLFGLLVIAFVGFSMGNAARTSATIYRGDTFVTFFLLIALVVFVEMFRQQEGKKFALPFGWEVDIRKLTVAILAGVALDFANFVWNGSPFADTTFMFAGIILITSAFVLRKEQLLSDSKYFLIALFVWYILALTAHAVSFIQGQQFVDPTFIPVYISMVLYWVILNYITSSIPSLPILRTTSARLGLIVGVVVVGAVAFSLVFSSIVYNVFVGNGFISAPGSFGTTIHELQPPTEQFLYTSFGVNLFTTLPTLLMYLPIHFNLGDLIWVNNLGIIGIVLLLILFIPYLFMQVYDSGGFLSGNARVRFDLNIAMVVIAAYFILTAYLQMHAIRFNSLVSVPIAILSAYTVYWLIAFVMGLAKKSNLVYPAAIVCTLVMIWFFYSLLSNDSIYSQTLSQADNINPYFISSLQWLKANTPNNSVALTLWPDGSVIEGVANRTSVTDSVGSQNGSKADPFAAWLLNSSPDVNFLTSSLSGKPNYFLVRTPWLIETQGIYTEAFISENVSQFGYLQLQQFSEAQVNSSLRQFKFQNGAAYPYVVVNLRNTNQINSSSQSAVYSYIQLNPNQVSPFEYLAFYNEDNANFTRIQQNVNNTNGELMLVIYSGVPKPNFFLNITGAYIFAPGIANSNMIKFLYFCNAYSCIWNNNQSSMQMVFHNPDTKIFKVTYKS